MQAQGNNKTAYHDLADDSEQQPSSGPFWPKQHGKKIGDKVVEYRTVFGFIA